MKDIRGALDLVQKRSLRLGLQLVATLLILTATALVYAGVAYRRALEVGTSVSTTGAGSTASAEVGLTPATTTMLAVGALVIVLSMFGFLREASKHISNAPRGRRSTPPPRLPSVQGEEWEESPTKEEGEE